jgi:hypothetical protein
LAPAVFVSRVRFSRRERRPRHFVEQVLAFESRPSGVGHSEQTRESFCAKCPSYFSY